MKTFKYIAAGFLAVIVVAAALYGVVRVGNSLVTRFGNHPTPSASPLGSIATPTPLPSVTPVQTGYKTPTVPAKTYVPKGQVKGARTVAVSSTTSNHVNLTIVKTNDCPITYTSTISDMTGPLTISYNITSGNFASITVWKTNGEELASQKTYGGAGSIVTDTDLSGMKLSIQSSTCNEHTSTSNTDLYPIWLTVTATR